MIHEQPPLATCPARYSQSGTDNNYVAPISVCRRVVSGNKKSKNSTIRVRGLDPDLGASDRLYTAAGLAVQRVAAPDQHTTFRAEDRHTEVNSP